MYLMKLRNIDLRAFPPSLSMRPPTDSPQHLPLKEQAAATATEVLQSPSRPKDSYVKWLRSLDDGDDGDLDNG